MRYQTGDGNTILADADFIAAHHPDAVLLPELPAPPAPPVRRLSKLGFIGKLGSDYKNILSASKTNIDVEMFVKQLDYATPNADGTCVDLDDPRVVYALNTLEAGGLIAAGRSAEILA